MKTSEFGFGIVGTGMIAGVIADAIARSNHGHLRAAASRQLKNAQQFVDKRPGVEPVQGVEPLLRCEGIDAVYVAVPTVAKEPIALAAIAAGKHVLVDKPFLDHDSLLRMTRAAAAKGVAFMDATHFVHHPRTAALRAATAEKLGGLRSMHTAFYFPFADRSNIRFDPKQEPMGAVGDLAWYSMRAVVEYLRPAGSVSRVEAVTEWDSTTNALVQAVGLIAFASGEVSTFNVGYTAGAVLMDLQLLGTAGVAAMDDFVLDWNNSFPFKNPDVETGYTLRAGMASRKDIEFVRTPSKTAQEVLMIDAFSALATYGSAAERTAFATASLKTQEYLDALWKAAIESSQAATIS